MNRSGLFEVTIVIVNYNTRQELHRCLESIENTPPAFSYQIVVVDNRSLDGSVDMVRKHFPQVELIENQCNIGLVRACNLAFRHVSSPFVALLDSDTLIEAGSLDRLYGFLVSHPQAGVVAPRVLNPDGTVQRTARSFPSAVNALFGRQSLLTRLFPDNRWSRNYLQAQNLDGSSPYQVDWVAFACMLFRTEVLNQVGPLDEDYFVYWSDADFCKKVSSRGYEIYCIPEAKIIHVEQNRRGRKRSPGSIIDFHRGSYLFYRKHFAVSPLHPMAWVALIGLSLRTLMLLIINQFRR